jgi:hypothetical protein
LFRFINNTPEYFLLDHFFHADVNSTVCSPKRFYWRQ